MTGLRLADSKTGPMIQMADLLCGFVRTVFTKIKNGQPKSLLRGLADRRLPRKVVEMPKRGFTAPTGAWLAGQYAEQFRSDVLGTSARSRDIVDTARVARLFEEHRRGDADHSFALWAVWMLERWARQEPAAVA